MYTLLTGNHTRQLQLLLAWSYPPRMNRRQASRSAGRRHARERLRTSIRYSVRVGASMAPAPAVEILAARTACRVLIMRSPVCYGQAPVVHQAVTSCRASIFHGSMRQLSGLPDYRGATYVWVAILLCAISTVSEDETLKQRHGLHPSRGMWKPNGIDGVLARLRTPNQSDSRRRFRVFVLSDVGSVRSKRPTNTHFPRRCVRGPR
jgi:hypothetical protein